MSCFFCDSNNHVSQNCDIYVSDESRQRWALLKNCCSKCLNYLDKSPCVKCESEKKCYICFSRNHHTVFCPDRIRASKTFFPSIDNDLLPRYVQLLKPQEKYTVAINYPVVFNAIKMTPFKIVYKKQLTLTFLNQDFFHSDTITIAEKFSVKHTSFPLPFGETVPIPLPLLPIIHASTLEIHSRTFSSHELLQLLSSNTKILKIGYTQFFSKLTFREILEAAPMLEGISINHSNIEVNYRWPEDMLELCHATCLKYLYLHIQAFNFNVESLVTLIKKNSARLFHVNLYLHLQLTEKEYTKKFIKRKIENYFVLKSLPFTRPCFKIIFYFYESERFYCSEFEDYVLKN